MDFLRLTHWPWMTWRHSLKSSNMFKFCKNQHKKSVFLCISSYLTSSLNICNFPVVQRAPPGGVGQWTHTLPGHFLFFAAPPTPSGVTWKLTCFSCGVRTFFFFFYTNFILFFNLKRGSRVRDAVHNHYGNMNLHLTNVCLMWPLMSILRIFLHVFYCLDVGLFPLCCHNSVN